MKLNIENNPPEISGLPEGEDVEFIFKDDKKYYVLLDSKKEPNLGKLYIGLDGQELEQQEVSKYVVSKERGIKEIDVGFIIDDKNMLIHIPIPLNIWNAVGLYESAKKGGENLVGLLEKIVVMGEPIKKEFS